VQVLHCGIEKDAENAPLHRQNVSIRLTVLTFVQVVPIEENTSMNEKHLDTSNNNNDFQNEQTMKRFDAALATRQFEIDLLWKRSLFFWGFISSAFVAIAALKGERPRLALLIAAFGFVCSFVWSLVNRGSKYWQEQWEKKLERCEDAAIKDHLFRPPREEAKSSAFPLWAGRRYSVSKLASAVSDLCCLVWLAIFTAQYAACLGKNWREHVQMQSHLVVIGVLIYVAVVLFFGRSDPDDKTK
jgi:hypothetical protein